MSKALVLLVFPLLLSGCNAIYNFADDAGKHLPTLGEPCNHWQCVTESGQKKSEEIKWLDEASEKQPTSKEKSDTKTPPISADKE